MEGEPNYPPVEDPAAQSGYFVWLVVLPYLF